MSGEKSECQDAAVVIETTGKLGWGPGAVSITCAGCGLPLHFMNARFIFDPSLYPFPVVELVGTAKAARIRARLENAAVCVREPQEFGAEVNDTWQALTALEHHGDAGRAAVLAELELSRKTRGLIDAARAALVALRDEVANILRGRS